MLYLYHFDCIKWKRDLDEGKPSTVYLLIAKWAGAKKILYVQYTTVRIEEVNEAWNLFESS